MIKDGGLVIVVAWFLSWFLSWFLVGFAVLFILHKVVRLSLKKLFDDLSQAECYAISTRILSGVQAIVVSCISLRTFTVCKDILYDRDPMIEMYIYPASAYFIYDLVVMYNGFKMRLFESGDKGSCLVLFLRSELFMVLHHVILECIGLPVILVWRKSLGTFFVAGFFLAELSTPFYNIRGILITLGIRSGIIYMCNALLFLVSFFVARVAMIPYLYYRYSQYAGIPIWLVPFTIPLQCNLASGAFMMLQCYWFLLILRHSVRILTKKTVSVKENSCTTNVELHDEKIRYAREKKR